MDVGDDGQGLDGGFAAPADGGFAAPADEAQKLPRSCLRAPFILFSDTRRAALKSEFPHMSPKDITVRLGKEWNELSNEQKQPFKDQYRRVKQQWQNENPSEAVWKPKDPLSADRRRRRRLAGSGAQAAAEGFRKLEPPKVAADGRVELPVRRAHAAQLQQIDGALTKLGRGATDAAVSKVVEEVLMPACGVGQVWPCMPHIIMM